MTVLQKNPRNYSGIPSTPPAAAFIVPRTRLAGKRPGHPAPRQGTAVPCIPAQQVQILEERNGLKLGYRATGNLTLLINSVILFIYLNRRM